MAKDLFSKISNITENMTSSSAGSRAVEAPVHSGSDVSRIASGVVLRGDISTRTDIRFDGQLDGKIFSEGRIVVGDTANIRGSIICTDIELWGKVEGDIYVKNVLSVKGTAIINGNIHVRKLQVEMGAQINGTCGMISEEQFTKMADEVVAVKLPKPAAPAPVQQPVRPAAQPQAAAPAPSAAPAPAKAEAPAPKPAAPAPAPKPAAPAPAPAPKPVEAPKSEPVKFAAEPTKLEPSTAEEIEEGLAGMGKPKSRSPFSY